MKLVINGVNFHASEICGPYWTYSQLKKLDRAEFPYGLAPIITDYLQYSGFKENQIANIKVDKTGLEIKIFKIPKRLHDETKQTKDRS